MSVQVQSISIDYWNVTIFLFFLCSILILYRKYVRTEFFLPIIILRSLLYTLLFVLSLNIILNINYKRSKPAPTKIFIDNSLSVSYYKHLSSLSYIKSIEQFIKKIKNKNIPVEVFSFGETLDTVLNVNDIKINQNSSNISLVIKNLKNDKTKGKNRAIVFSDGQINRGVSPSSLSYNGISQIFAIGVGDLKPLVDVSIKSIELPPVIIKGENIDIKLLIESQGIIDENVNVSIFKKNSLVASKNIRLTGDGTVNEVLFLINSDEIGYLEYEVQVSVLADEINIQNNRELINLQVLKDRYQIAMITGAPTFNTKFLKELILNDKKNSLDHFIFKKDGLKPSLKSFWSNSYDLIIFDNHPTTINSEEWDSYIKILIKKLVAQKSNFAIIPGEETNYNSLEKHLNILDLNISKTINSTPNHTWSSLDYTSKENYPLFNMFENIATNSLPPFDPKVYFNNNQTSSFVIGEKKRIRYFYWNSDDFSIINYMTRNSNNSDFIKSVWREAVGWLLRTGGNENIFFRTNKNSYQQGEVVEVRGKAIGRLPVSIGDIYFTRNDSILSSKKIEYDRKNNEYYSSMIASSPGIVSYFIDNINGKSSNISSRSFRVKESHIELNNIFLNEKLLKSLSKNTGGKFYFWKDKEDLLVNFNQIKNETFNNEIFYLNRNTLFLMLILLLFIIEWIIRRKYGLI